MKCAYEGHEMDNELIETLKFIIDRYEGRNTSSVFILMREFPWYDERNKQLTRLQEAGLITKPLFYDNGALITLTHVGRHFFDKDINMDKYSKVLEFIQRGEEIGKEESQHPGIPMTIVSGPKFDAWLSEIEIFNDRYLKTHTLNKSIATTCFHKANINAYKQMMGYLRALASDKVFFGIAGAETDTDPRIKPDNSNDDERKMSNKIFVVHGHDDVAKLEMARTLTNGGFEPIILNEKPDSGQTIIEKIERFSDVCYAIVLYTECDVGRDKTAPVGNEQYRARQNVVFEHGYLIAKLGRKNVTALVKGDVEKPSDICGILYVPMDAAGGWKSKLALNMKDVGIDVDMNKFCV